MTMPSASVKNRIEGRAAATQTDGAFSPHGGENSVCFLMRKEGLLPAPHPAGGLRRRGSLFRDDFFQIRNRGFHILGGAKQLGDLLARVDDGGMVAAKGLSLIHI